MSQVKTLEDLAYEVWVQQKGTKVINVKEGAFYKMIERDGINLLDLGKCIKIECECPCYFNDGCGYITFTFEKNNDNKLLWKSFYGSNMLGKYINIIEYNENENKNT